MLNVIEVVTIKSAHSVKVRPVFKVLSVHRDRMDAKAVLVNRENLDRLGYRASVVPLGQRGVTVTRVDLGNGEHRVIQAVTEFPERLVHKVKMVNVVKLDKRETQVEPGLLVFQVIWDQRVCVDQPVKKVNHSMLILYLT